MTRARSIDSSARSRTADGGSCLLAGTADQCARTHLAGLSTLFLLLLLLLLDLVLLSLLLVIVLVLLLFACSSSSSVTTRLQSSFPRRRYSGRLGVFFWVYILELA